MRYSCNQENNTLFHDDKIFQSTKTIARGLIIEINNITSGSKNVIRSVVGCIVWLKNKPIKLR